MTRRHSTLQKKLKELESILNDLFSLPPDTLYNHQLYAQDIEQRFDFLRKLLSAEISSHPNKPYHLPHIARRLTELESIYKEWDTIKALTVVQHFQPLSTCSSCLNNGGGDGDVPSEFYEGLIREEENYVDAGDEKEKERIRVYGKYIGGMVVIGMALMGFVIVKFSGCFICVERKTFNLLAPT